RDYHDILKKKLKRLGRWIGEETGQALKVFVDTAPVPEKALAAQTAVGWQGKHSNLVSQEFGSWLFLGLIYLGFELPTDSPSDDHCGSCSRCIDVCPTAAIPAPYQLDATRCLAYLSIEHDGPIPVEFRAAMGNRIYGCDDCLAVCPWNKFAQATAEAGFQPRALLADPRLLDFVGYDDAQFRAAFAGSPVKRIGIVRFLRNLAICLGNSGHEKARGPLEQLARHENAVVAESAVWALDQLRSETPAA
ncbi:MAG: tRNA epoxyqueuosine(34) reductase QueG, partial [Pseudomonadota bacterium]|nr:tRNA epoxyqueuosine(34) reductase QueG [Pseudomonadota bacterium]